MQAQVGSYRIVGAIGEGGMGAVYRAEHTQLGKRVAIKVLKPELSAEPEMVQRFFNEARAATAIRHPGIIEIFDFGAAPDGSAYIVMELLDGESLASRLRRGRMPLPQVTRLVRQVGRALGAAHAQGIVHRDLKPDNIFLCPDPEVAGGERAKILDFGIAKLADTEHGVRTRTGAIVGTPMYMSPEQCRGTGEVGARADLYALGIILFEMLCGRPPYQSAGLGELFAAHMFTPTPPPRMYEPAIPLAIEGVVTRLLAKDPAQRFASAEEMVAALDAAEGTMPTTPSYPPPPPMMQYANTMPSPAPIGSPAPLMSPPPAYSVPAYQVAPRSMPPPKKGVNLWLVIGLPLLGVVIVFGVLAVLAVKGVEKYKKRAHTSEAEMYLHEISRDLSTYFIEHSALPTATAGPTPPLHACCDSSSDQCTDYEQWSSGTWSDIGFEAYDSKFSYTYTPSADGKSYTLTAVGDPDCGGKDVTLTVHGTAGDDEPKIERSDD